jgi:phosphatidate cytidylyltransferase
MTVLLFATWFIPARDGMTQNYSNMLLMCLWVFAAAAASFIYGWKINERGTYDAATTAASLVYIPFFTYHMVLIDRTEYRLLVWMVVIAAFGSDIFAYFTGYFLGKHKMAPNLSPKKTIEGSIGGIIGVMLIIVAYAYVAGNIMKVSVNIYSAIAVGFIAGIVSQFGDLCASIIKREHNVKDFGNIMPGHGGVMDRFDSLLFVAPAVYYILKFFPIFS